MKLHPVPAELFHADGRTDMTKLIVAFRNFANVPKMALYPRMCKSVDGGDVGDSVCFLVLGVQLSRTCKYWFTTKQVLRWGVEINITL